MNKQSPKGNGRDRQTETTGQENTRNSDNSLEEREPGKGHGPLKGTDTPATTNAEDEDSADRTTM